uniref:MICOS complex subunit MIC13 n=1 Tax=Molossus molossus TaxID=27622 RepID=A0A7J8I966_MOLMO|nr:mitochondrial contact site and cristae organizing system subunit 13 [Molossus molossus]
MVSRVWSMMRFLIKGSVAGGVVYLVYDQELLGPSDKSQAVLRKAEEVVPPAMYQFSHSQRLQSLTFTSVSPGIQASLR